MALPTSPTWNLADFSGPTLGSLLSLGPSDLTITPGASPYFSYNDDFSVLTARSADGALAMLDFHVAIPPRFTVEMTLRFPEMPHNLADLESRRAGLTVADDGGRGIAIYFATTGMAVSRVDDFGSVTALPDTTDTTEEIATQFKTIRVAVDSGLGRAYVFIGNAETVSPEVRFILPVEATPATVLDVFRLFVKGLSTQPSRVEIRALRLAGDLVVPNFPPTADAGPDRVAPVGQAVRFDGRASFDIEGAPLTYLWHIFDAPFGSQYAADNSSGSTVDDGDADGFTDLLSFTPNSLPAWVASGDVLRIGSERHIIDTVDNPGGQLTTVAETIPDNLSTTPFRIIDQSALVGADTETPYLIADVQGVYRVELVVNDGESDSEAAEVLASIVGARAPFGVEPDVTPIWKALGDEWGLVSNRGVFEEAWRGVAQILAGRLLEVWQYHYNYSIRDAQRTFQRKWIAYRSLITETDPDSAVISPRYGLVRASHEFEVVAPAVTGQTLVFEYFTGASPTDVATLTVTLAGTSLTAIIATVNAALAGTGISAYGYALRKEDATYRALIAGGSTIDDGDADGFTNTLSFPALALPSWVAPGDTLVLGGERYTIATVNNPGGSLTITAEELPDDLTGASFIVYRIVRLAFKAMKGFRIASGTAMATLGITTAYNYLEGLDGALVTDRTYYAGDGLDLNERGVQRGDLLVLNNGQSFRIDRVLTAEDDPLAGQRLLLVDELPFDTSESWSIPSVVQSEVDYEFEGSYPGDLVKAEVFDADTNSTTDVLGRVVAQKGTQLAANLSGFFGALLDDERYEIRLLGVKRRKAMPIADDTISIPRLQDIIPEKQYTEDGTTATSRTIWEENVHYVLEPFYRDIGGAPIPQLQFRDSVFIDPDLEPPDIFWAELTVFSNDQNVEDLFGRLAGFLRDDASAFSADFNYVSGVAGLIYAQQRGPSVNAVRVGAQILFGQPFAEVAGKIEEIRFDFSPTTGRMLVRDATGDPNVTSEIIRTYYYRKDPLDLASTSGLAINPATDLPWAVGDDIAQFAPIGAGVEIIDMYNDPTWYVPYVRSGLMTEIEKFHTFLVRYNLDLVTLSNLSLLFSFITKVKPTYTHHMLVGLRQAEEDIDVIDDLRMTLYMHLYDSVCGSPRTFMYDDYRGDGTIWSLFDDGLTYYDGIVDCPLDIIVFVLTITWGGGIITYDSIFFLDTQVEDVSGTLGPPGSFFTPTYDMNLPAGTYRVTATIKGGGVVLP
jgi:hypothetical protein